MCPVAAPNWPGVLTFVDEHRSVAGDQGGRVYFLALEE